MEELKLQLVDVCNASGLPLEAIVFVTKDLWRDAEDALRAYKNQMAATQPQEETKEEVE